MKKAVKKATKKTSKEVAVKPSNEVSTEVNSAWGAGDNIDSKDILIPKILCAQAISKAVMDDDSDVCIGDFYDSIEKKVFDKMQKGNNSKLEILVFNTFKTWVIFEDGKYARTEFHSPENSHYTYQDEVDGVMINRDSVINFYCLLPSEIEECSEAAFPYVMPFKRTSRSAGQKLTTLFAKWRSIGKPSAWKVLEITRKKEDGEKGTYYVMDVRVGRDATQEELNTAYKWYKTLEAAKNVVIDDSDYSEPVEEDDTVDSEY